MTIIKCFELTRVANHQRQFDLFFTLRWQNAVKAFGQYVFEKNYRLQDIQLSKIRLAAFGSLARQVRLSRSRQVRVGKWRDAILPVAKRPKAFCQTWWRIPGSNR